MTSQSNPAPAADPNNLNHQISQTQRTSTQFLAAIELHTRRRKEQSLYPGVNYHFFERFLARGSPHSTLPGSVSQQSSHVFACIHRFVPSTGIDGVVVEAHRDLKEYSGEELSTEIDKLSKQEAQDTANGTKRRAAYGELVFLRGHPSAGWLKNIGAYYAIDPEFLRRHLIFLQSQDYHELPGLPSSGQSMIELRVTTICTRKSKPLRREDVPDARREAIEEISKHHRNFSAVSRPGDSVVRKFSIHSEDIFTIEQNISIYIKSRSSNSRWTVIVWMDNGRPLTECTTLSPWTHPGTHTRSPTECWPVLPFLPMLALTGQQNDHLIQKSQTDQAVSGQSRPHSGIDDNQSDNSTQSASILPSRYGEFLDKEQLKTACESPIYALHELFHFAANSACQYLNFLKTQVEREKTTVEDDWDNWTSSLENIQHSKSLVDEQKVYLKGIVRHLNGFASQAKQGSAGVQSEEEKASSILISDYEDLIQRATALSDQCKEGIFNINSIATLEAASQAIDESRRTKKLTLLAFFFLPLTLGTSVFGMNFNQMNDVNIWWCFPVFAVLICLSLVLAFPHVLDKLSGLLWWRRKKRASDQESNTIRMTSKKSRTMSLATTNKKGR